MQPPGSSLPPPPLPPLEDSRLEPLAASDIVGRAVGLWWRNLWPISGVIGIAAVPVEVISTLAFVRAGAALPWDIFSTPGAEPSPQEMQRFLEALVREVPLMAIGFLVGILGFFVLQAVAIPLAADLHFGRPVTIGRAYRQVFNRVWPLIGAYLLQFLIVLGAIAAIVAVFVVAAIGGGAGSALLVLAGVLGIFAAIGYGVYAAVRVSFFSQYILLEGQGPWGALKASWRLVGGTWWRVVGVFILLAIVNFVLNLPILIISGMFTDMAPSEGPTPFTFNGPVMVVTGVLGAIVSAMATIGAVVLFYDVRVRKGEVFTVAPEAHP